MPLTGLFHIAIKTADLGATVRFYCDVLGLRQAKRPAFDFPGAWLALSMPGGDAIFHIYAGGPAMGPSGIAPNGTAAIDHVSLAAIGFHDYRAKFEQFGLPYREFLVPGTTLWQLFVYDPSGVQLELTFEGAAEPGRQPDMSPGHGYLAGTNFFDPEKYKSFATREFA